MEKDASKDGADTGTARRSLITRLAPAILALTSLIAIGTLRYLQVSKAIVIPHYIYVTGALFAIALVGAALLWLASTTDLLRDSFPTDFGMARSKSGQPLRRPFSMAQTQMAWWFFLVFAAYIYLLLTGGNSTISDQALALMGIGAGTALGGAAIEQNKTNTKLQQLQALVNQAATAQLQHKGKKHLNPFLQPLNDLARQLAATNFFNDILTDVDGVALHRFQMLVWTLLFGTIFVSEVLYKAQMPQFDAKTLALLGLSGGTYLGFKIPEQPS